MPTDDVLRWTAAVSGVVSALVGGVIAGIFGLWMKRRDAAHSLKLENLRADSSRDLEAIKGDLNAKLEKAKGEIAAELKVTEARLRIDAETELRLRERSWDLLVEIQKAAFTADMCLGNMIDRALEYAQGKPVGTPSRAALADASDQADKAMASLFAATHAAPPRFADQLDKARQVWREAMYRAIDCSEKPNGLQADSLATVAHNRRQDAMKAMGPALERWAHEVWNAEGALLHSMVHGQGKAAMAAVPEPNALSATAPGDA